MVAGFDDIPDAAYVTPPLTTVRQDFLAIGRHAITMLRTVNGSDFGVDAVVPADRVVRESSTPREPA